MEIAVILVASLTLAATLANWRLGLLLTMVTGFVQDPLRKLMEGEPIYATGLVALAFAIVVAVEVMRGVLPRPSLVYGWRRWLRASIVSFLALVAVQTAHGLAGLGTPGLVFLGFWGYLAPLLSAWIGYRYARYANRIRTFLACYVALVAAVSVGVMFSFLGYDWPILRQVGSGLTVFSQGVRLEVHSGFWRSPEVAAWHAGAAVSFLMILWTLTRRSAWRLLIAGLIVYLIGAGLLSGRRKMLVGMVVFLAVYAILLLYFRQGAHRLAGLAVAVGVVATIVALEALDEPRELNPYMRHGVSGFQDAPERLRMLGLGSVEWAIQRHGVLGAGVGAGTQGAQHFASGSVLTGGAAEGGLGKVTTELGVPGLAMLGWLVVAVGRLIWRSLPSRPARARADSTVRYGLVAFLAANAVTFVIASQVYGDPFVVLLVGWVLGLVVGTFREHTWNGQIARLKTDRGRFGDYRRDEEGIMSRGRLV